MNYAHMVYYVKSFPWLLSSFCCSILFTNLILDKYVYGVMLYKSLKAGSTEFDYLICLFLYVFQTMVKSFEVSELPGIQHTYHQM